jgi:hypothetical protein
VELPADHPVASRQLELAARSDPDLFRVLVRALNLLDDERAVASPDVAAAVHRAVPDVPPSPPAAPGTDAHQDRAAWLRVLEPFS